MKIAALISGGKDSLYAAYKVGKEHDIVCLIALESEREDSWVFHTANVSLVKIQAKAMKLPLIYLKTSGIKEEEVKDLKKAIKTAKEKYKIQGIVSGAIKSNYQKQRVEKVCKELKISSLTPLWHVDEEEYLKNLIKDKFEVIVTLISAYGLNKELLAKKIDNKLIEKLKEIHEKHKINISGEGGEFDSLVLDCPLFYKKIKIEKAYIQMENEFSGKYLIKKARLINKSL